MKIFPVILCGGSGTRLWPLSREALPKQFIPICDEWSGFQQALQRTELLQSSYPALDMQKPIVVCHQDHRFLAAQQAQARNIDLEAIIIEPDRRNTAPALCLAAHFLKEKYENSLMLVLSADHYIENTQQFNKAIVQVLNSDCIGTQVGLFGIKPHSAHTGYGYIETNSKEISTTGDDHIKRVVSFHEKPGVEKATEYYQSNNYFWNSGNLCLSTDTWLSIVSNINNKLYKSTKHAIKYKSHDLDFVRIHSADYLSALKCSIDYAVLENIKDLSQLKHHPFMVEIECGWKDIGSWDAVTELIEADENNNKIYGDTILQESKDTMVYSTSRLVAAIGVKDLSIIETTDAVLVLGKHRSQGVRDLVSKLNAAGRDEVKKHQREYRPWGSYETLDKTSSFIVKRLSIKPKHSLSLQKHQFRAEHWIVVSGIATVDCDEKRYNLSPSQSTFIPQGSVHRLSNYHEQYLEVIEVQTGEKLSEEDIVRFSDQYGRTH